MLLGGRSGRVHLAKDDETGEYIQVIHDGNSSPLLEIVYTFFKEPTSSPPAKLWALVMCLLALSRVLAMACETVNGPQFYEGRPNQSIYPWMPDHNTYYMLYLSMCIPFLVDAVGRLVVVCASFSDWDGPCAKAFRQDKLAQFLTACNIISVIPFVAGLFLFPGTYSYDKILYSTGRISAAAHLNKISSTEAIRVLFRVMNLLVSSHVLRYVKHLTVIKTVALALSRAGPHLVLPIFFFFVFNIIFGVVFYFAEPCYDTSSCPWQDMLDSTFFSIVAMCTVGYGNQVPATDFGRFVTVFVMLFGALFISMPLALIGNEYTDAVVEVQQQIEAEQELWAQRAESISAARETHRIQLKLLGQLVPTAHDSEESKTEDTQEISPEELELSQIRKSLLMQYFSKIQVCATLLEYQLDKAIEGKRNFDAVYITAPALLLQAETMAAMPPFMAALKGSTVAVIRDAVITKNTDIVESNTTANSAPDEQSETLAKDAKTAKEQAADEKNTNHKKNYKNKIKNKKKRGKGSNTRKDSDIISLPSSGAGSDMDDEDSSISEVGEEGGTDSNESEDDMAKAIDQSKVGDDYIKSMQRQFAAQKSAPGPMRDSFRMAISSQKRSNKAKKRIAKGLSFVESFSLPTPIQNFFSRLKSIIGTGLDGKPMRPTLRARVQYEENAFTTKLRRVLDNPKTLHHRVWMFLELPHSSKQAYYYRLLMLCFIVLSVSVFFLETLNYFHSYGPDTKICGDVLMQYCSNKSPSTDPGCFVQTQTGTTMVALSYINNRYLFPQQMYDPVQDPTGTAYAYYEMPVIDANWESYYSQPTDAQTLQDSVTMMIDSCYRTHRDKWNSQTRKFPHMPGDAGNNIKAGYPYPLPNNEVAYMSYPLNECHRFGFNLGTHIFQVQNVTQVLDSHMPPTGSNVEVSVVNVPYSPVSCTDETKKSYQDVDELVYTFGAIGATTSRGKVQQQAAICSRIECSGQPAASDLGKYFKYIEVACFAMFLIDICARMFISDSLWLFFTDKIALLDLVALSPFVILIVQQVNTKNI